MSFAIKRSVVSVNLRRSKRCSSKRSTSRMFWSMFSGNNARISKFLSKSASAGVWRHFLIRFYMTSREFRKRWVDIAPIMLTERLPEATNSINLHIWNLVFGAKAMPFASFKRIFTAIESKDDTKRSNSGPRKWFPNYGFSLMKLTNSVIVDSHICMLLAICICLTATVARL